MNFNWTTVTEKSTISTKLLIDELNTSIKSVANYLDSKYHNHDILNSLPINNYEFKQYGYHTINERDSIYDSIDILHDNITCVADKGGYNVSVKNSCHSYVSSANTSHNASKYTTDNSSPYNSSLYSSHCNSVRASHYIYN